MNTPVSKAPVIPWGRAEVNFRHEMDVKQSRRIKWVMSVELSSLLPQVELITENQGWQLRESVLARMVPEGLIANYSGNITFGGIWLPPTGECDAILRMLTPWGPLPVRRDKLVYSPRTGKLFRNHHQLPGVSSYLSILAWDTGSSIHSFITLLPEILEYKEDNVVTGLKLNLYVILIGSIVDHLRQHLEPKCTHFTVLAGPKLVHRLSSYPDPKL